ncbi:MAG: hypothetical protein ACLQLC_07825 [Candidatus Sulfotelmatobacter sp.]
MPSVAKIVKLQVISSLWANLCFEVGGIVEVSNVTLGQSVTQFDFASFYATLGVATETVEVPVVGGGGLAGHPAGPGPTNIKVPVKEPANLLDSQDIQNGSSASTLMALRAEPIKAVLDKACALRANAFYGRYNNQTAIIAQMRQNYSFPNPPYQPSPTSKPGYLATLSGLATQQYQALTNAYKLDSIRNSTGTNQGVVQSTTSTLQSATVAPNVSSISTSSDAKGNVTGNVVTNEGIDLDNPSIPLPQQPAGFNFPNVPSDPNAVLQAQNMTYTDYGFRVPYIECQAQNVRAQISLMDEQFAQFVAGQSLPNLENVFQNELLAIDMDVKRLQVAYLNTILMSPITGVVTGVYKNVGDRVLPGETVVRVENTSSVYLVGVLIYRGVISLQANVSIQTTLFSASTATTITGTVVAARGDQSGDDRWEVVFLCPNGTSGNPTLPVNYYFDYDEVTSITFS